MAFRYLAEELNNTEIGLYYMNYHSRLPTVRATQGTARQCLCRSGGRHRWWQPLRPIAARPLVR